MVSLRQVTLMPLVMLALAVVSWIPWLSFIDEVEGF